MRERPEPETDIRLLMKLARHLRNTDEIELFRWGAMAVDLLAEVQKKHPEEFERQVES